MRTIHFLLATPLCIMLASCSLTPTSKMIQPTSTEFSSGELAKYIVIVDEPCQLSFTEKEGAIDTQYIRLKVELEMIKDGLEDVDPHDIGFTGLVSVATINLIDKEGIPVKDLDLVNEDYLKLKKLLTGDEGDTQEVIFEGKYHAGKEAINWFNEAEQFTPRLTSNIKIQKNKEAKETSLFSDEESEDWKQLRDTYDAYVTKYTACVKEMEQGDMNALSEYPALLQKAQELGEKLEDAQGSMSISQWDKYLKITNKLTMALSEIPQE